VFRENLLLLFLKSCARPVYKAEQSLAHSVSKWPKDGSASALVGLPIQHPQETNSARSCRKPSAVETARLLEGATETITRAAPIPCVESHKSNILLIRPMRPCTVSRFVEVVHC
jgi:hypothetical protein